MAEGLREAGLMGPWVTSRLVRGCNVLLFAPGQYLMELCFLEKGSPRHAP